MDFFEVIGKRRSIRAFRDQPVPEEMVQKILETIQAAPSAGNRQAYEVVVVRDPVRKKALAEAAWQQTFIAQAPVVLVFCTNPGRNVDRYRERGAHLYCIQDASIAVTFAHLAATALGLGSCWIGAFDPSRVATLIGAEGTIEPVAMLPLGFPAETPPPTPRRSLSSLVHQEQLRKP
jgi:nitroreductase